MLIQRDERHYLITELIMVSELCNFGSHGYINFKISTFKPDLHQRYFKYVRQVYFKLGSHRSQSLRSKKIRWSIHTKICLKQEKRT